MLRLPALASASFTVSSIRGPAALIAARPTVRGAAGSAGVRMLEEEDIPEAFKGASKRKPPNPEVQIIDREGDECRFILEDGELRLYVQGELFCEAIENMSYSREEGRIFIEDEEVEGSFQIREGEEMMKAAQLAVFGRQCGAPPVQPGTAPHRSAEVGCLSAAAAALPSGAGVEWDGDEPITLPDEVEKLLIDDELKDSREGVRLLWAHLLEVYPSEEARRSLPHRHCVAFAQLGPRRWWG